MNPPCGRCKKAVYPTEKLNCLDKYWHKSCFSCEVCKMALSMNNYKGFDKKPYCSMHYPKMSFTIVTETPENLRLKQQTMLNSQALYKEDFEKNKGKGCFVADTPEMQRVKKTQDQISNIKYHEEFEKSKVPVNAPPPENRKDDEEKQPAQPQVYNQQPGPVRPAAVAPPSGGKRYQALYSYTAADADEVSLQEGDLISDVEPIDDGWIYGRNQRTGQRGMLPANYVQAV